MLTKKESDLSYEITQQARAIGWGDHGGIPYVNFWLNANDKSEHRVQLRNIDYTPWPNKYTIYAGASYVEALQKLHAALPPESVTKLAEMRARTLAKTEAYLQIRKLIAKVGGDTRFNRYDTEGAIEVGSEKWYDETSWEGGGDPRARDSKYYKVTLTFGRLRTTEHIKPWDCVVQTNCVQRDLSTEQFRSMITLFQTVNNLADEIREILALNFP